MSFFGRVFFFSLQSVFQAALSFGILPLTTLILGPRDYGLFAFVTTLASVGVALGSVGSTYLLSAHYPSGDEAVRRQCVSSVLITGAAVLCACLALFWAAWPWLSMRWAVLAEVPRAAMVLGSLTALLGFPWLIASDIATLDGRAKFFSTVQIIQAAVSAAWVLLGLYVFNLGGLALFAGAAAGALCSFIGAWRVLTPHFRWTLDRRWWRENLHVSALSSVGQVLEQVQVVFERSLLSHHGGLGSLGLYVHSQQYKNVLFTFVKPVTRSVWPVTLAESRDPAGRFEKTRDAWAVVHVGLTAVGLFFATLGGPFVSFLTHGKFAGAAPLVAFWVIYLLLACSGRAQLGHLFATGRAKYLALVTSVTVAIGVGALFLLTPRWGAGGAIAAVMLQQVLYRCAMVWKAEKDRSFPFQDGWAVAGIGVVSACVGMSSLGPWSLAQSASQFVLVTAGYAAVVYPVLGRHVWAQIWQRHGPAKARA